MKILICLVKIPVLYLLHMKIDSSDVFIKKVSSNFTSFFGIQQKEFVDRKIEVWMPPKIQLIKKHKSYLINYLQNENNNISYFKDKFLFGFSQKGFIFPVKIDVCLNYCNGLNEVGLTAQVKQIINENEYILFESDSLNVIGITQHIQQIIFSKISISLQKQTYLGQFFPFLYKLSKDSKIKQQQEINIIRQDSGTKKLNHLKNYYFNQVLEKAQLKKYKQTNLNTFNYKIKIFLLQFKVPSIVMKQKF
ncbi:hypothetical protein ABPG72_015173 [Tetrahymena utriculariae]